MTHEEKMDRALDESRRAWSEAYDAEQAARRAYTAAKAATKAAEEAYRAVAALVEGREVIAEYQLPIQALLLCPQCGKGQAQVVWHDADGERREPIEVRGGRLISRARQGHREHRCSRCNAGLEGRYSQLVEAIMLIGE